MVAVFTQPNALPCAHIQFSICYGNSDTASQKGCFHMCRLKERQRFKRLTQVNKTRLSKDSVPHLAMLYNFHAKSHFSRLWKLQWHS